MKTYTIKRIKDGATLDGVTDENYWTIQPFIKSMNDLICETGTNDWHRLADVVYVNMIGETEEMKAVDWVAKSFRERVLEEQKQEEQKAKRNKIRSALTFAGGVTLLILVFILINQ